MKNFFTPKVEKPSSDKEYTLDDVVEIKGFPFFKEYQDASDINVKRAALEEGLVDLEKAIEDNRSFGEGAVSKYERQKKFLLGLLKDVNREQFE